MMSATWSCLRDVSSAFKIDGQPLWSPPMLGVAGAHRVAHVLLSEDIAAWAWRHHKLGIQLWVLWENVLKCYVEQTYRLFGVC